MVKSKKAKKVKKPKLASLVRVIKLNKSGVVIDMWANKCVVKFVDGTSKICDKSELEVND